MTADRVRIAAHAKANVLLRVLAREASGYHSVETLFTLLELADDLVVERAAGGIELAVEGADTGPAEKNLAYQAARMVLAATGERFGVRMHLTKHIPVQAGLGGGSSDGAAALEAVNRLAGDAVPRHEILQFAARLGSDVPFFATGAPFALAWGRGERLYRLPPPPAAPALLALPPLGIDTAEAYQRLDASRPLDTRRGAVALDAEALATWGSLSRLGGNDFENVVFGKEPRLKHLYQRLAETGPLLVRLCGSGSALIAVYRHEAQRESAALEVGERDCRLVKTSTRALPPSGPSVQV